ncbi:hypothetical protein ACLOAU_00560 [Niabella sp. CJ426]|uniref:hypothetical protein n=1 Tax=Niabella sp. CJ426 TaxID=3393740 RepID=UPI003CFEB69D
MFRKTNFVAIAALLSGYVAHAQVISNPGFETYSSCPNNVSQLNRATPWVNALGGTAGTPDFFNCSYNITAADYEGITAQSGTGFIGGYAEFNSSNGGFSNYKEYFTTQLSTALVAGKTYTFSFYVAHLYGSTTPATNFVAGVTYVDLPDDERGFLGAAFSTAAPVAANTEGNVTPRWTSIKSDFGLGRVLIPSTNIAVYGNTSRNTWVPVTLQYTAVGGETYMTLGQFRPGNTSLPANNGAYFLFDGFSSQLTALPVSFGNVQATVNNNQLTVNWQTIKETNNDHFVIEASADGISFTPIGELATRAANGNSDTSISYTFSRSANEVALGAGLVVMLLGGTIVRRRRTVALLLMGLGCTAVLYSCSKGTGEGMSDPDGKYFIRVAQVDKDGTTSYSKTISVVKK